MMKRLFVATGIFGLGIFLLLLPTLWSVVRIVRAQASGIGVDVYYWTFHPKLAGVATLLLLVFFRIGFQGG